MQITGGIYNSRKVKTAEFENIKPTLSKTRQGIFNTLGAMIDFENKVFFQIYQNTMFLYLTPLYKEFLTSQYAQYVYHHPPAYNKEPLDLKYLNIFSHLLFLFLTALLSPHSLSKWIKVPISFLFIFVSDGLIPAAGVNVISPNTA